MKKLIMATMVVAYIFLSGCTTFPKNDINVAAQADPKANFSGYKSYAWLGSAGILNDPEGMWEPPQFDADSEIKFLIDRELRKRGMSENSNTPDLIVAYALGVDMAALKVKEDPQTKLSTLENVPQGALLLVLVDADSGFVIWASTASAEIKNLDPETTKKRLDYAITQMFKQLPK